MRRDHVRKCGRALRLHRGFEWRTRAEIFGWPLIHIPFGRNKHTGKLLVAKGVVGIGRCVWSTRVRDPEAVTYLVNLWHPVKGLLGG